MLILGECLQDNRLYQKGLIQTITFTPHNNPLEGMPHLHPLFQDKPRLGETQWPRVHSLSSEETTAAYISLFKYNIHP